MSRQFKSETTCVETQSRQFLRAKLRHLRDEEEGSTTVAAALFIAAFVALTLVGVAAGVNVVKARQAAVAADLSAVAGAVAAQEGDKACEAAERIASANRARVLTCEIDGEDVQVTVERRNKEATARAGPAPAPAPESESE